MAQRTYHPLAKLAFAAAAVLTLLTLTLHGRHPAPANEPAHPQSQVENFNFSTQEQP